LLSAQSAEFNRSLAALNATHASQLSALKTQMQTQLETWTRAAWIGATLGATVGAAAGAAVTTLALRRRNRVQPQTR
jgi:TctA family transporter